MKISAWHKQQNDYVKLLLSYDEIEDYDKVYLSKVFTDTPVPDGITDLSWVEYGGTGFFFDNAPPLPDEIEHTMPDYHLYDEFVSNSDMPKADRKIYQEYSFGFTTRGCMRGCSFCVNRNSRASVLHSPVSEFVDPERPNIFLLDDNVLACRDWKQIFDDLNATGKKFRFHQGMDERLLTPEKCDVIFNSNWIGDFIFAFDNIKDRRLVEKKLQLIREHTSRIPKFYVFCGYNHDDPGVFPDGFWEQDIIDVFERIRVLMKYQALPYIMRHQDFKKSPYQGMYHTLARWCNQPSFVKKKSFREYCLDTKGQSAAAARYCLEFERQYPEIAAEYFDMKWSDFL